MRSSFTTELKVVFFLSIPLVLTNLAQLAMSVTDMVFIGELGKTYIAAATLGINLYNTVVFFGFGLVIATAPLVSQCMGSVQIKKRRAVRASVHQGMLVAILYSIPACIFLWNGESVLLALNQDPYLAEYAGIYLQTMLWALPPFLLFIVLRSFCAALHKAHWTLAITCIGILINAIGNWALVSGKGGFPRWELWGSGFASAIATWLMFFSMLVMVGRQSYLKTFRVARLFARKDFAGLKKFLRVGFPIGIATSFEVTIFSAAAILIGWLSEDELSAHSIALLLASISFMIPHGIGQAATIRVGYAHGAKSIAGITMAGHVTLFMGMVVMLLASALFILIPHTLIAPFIDIHTPANQGVVFFAIQYLWIAALFQFVDGLQVLTVGMLRGLSKTTIPMLVAGVGYWIIGFPVGYLLLQSTSLRGLGVWLGLALGLTIVAVWLIIYWMRALRSYPTVVR